MGIDRILIVDNDIKLLNSLKSGLDKFRQFKILTAFDGMQALAILKREKVSILVTCLRMRRMDGLELLAEVTREYPNILSIVTTSLSFPLTKDVQGDSLFSYLNKPFNHLRLHSEILKVLDCLDEINFKSGIYLTSMLPLINLERKTCLLEFSAGRDRKGFFHFDNGVICDVRCDDLADSEALEKMLFWGPGQYWFKPLPDDPAVTEFHGSLAQMLGEGDGFKDLDRKIKKR
ncbi:MAG: response regulator [Desulfobulbaceae bacterium]|nr:response regulator [Desulfobulbaceae bacterium]